VNRQKSGGFAVLMKILPVFDKIEGKWLQVPANRDGARQEAYYCMANFDIQFNGGMRLTTAQILYHLPDHPRFLQEFIWQEYDMAPRYPHLRQFLSFWVREIEGKLHSVFVAHQQIITPSDGRFIAFEDTV
jgi:uncharacterized protein Usg